jgi:hypothetical protein
VGAETHMVQTKGRLSSSMEAGRQSGSYRGIAAHHPIKLPILNDQLVKYETTAKRNDLE